MPTLRSAPMSDLIERPLDVVHSMFDKASNQLSADSDWGVEDHFKKLMEDSAQREQIPLLTPENCTVIPNKSLCRFQGMIQDMMDPEYYIGAFKQPGGYWQTTKFSDSLTETIQQDYETVLWDRKPFYCGRAPGQSNWSLKTGSLSGTKQQSTGAAPAITGASQKGDCVVIVYGEGDSLKLNEVVEIVGIMSRPMECSLQAEEASGAHPEEDLDVQWPPESEQVFCEHWPGYVILEKVPRIHALTCTKLLRSEDLPVPAFKGSKERQEQVAELRTAALDFLQPALGGDTLAAEYILLQLISRVHSRTDSGMQPAAEVLGQLSLGITNCPSNSKSRHDKLAGGLGSPKELSAFGEMVVTMLSALVPRVLGLPITIDELNSRSWRPTQDPTTSRLTRAPLQLAENTHLVLDETMLQAGQLTTVGLKNVEALKTLLESQSVAYDFGVYNLPIPADVPVLILSERNSLLQASINVSLPLNPTAQLGTVEGVLAAAEGEALRSVRAYLALMRFTDFKVPKTVTGFLEKELAAAHRNDVAKMHTWMTLARLVALSHGEDELTVERWAQMRALEHAREQRLRVS